MYDITDKSNAIREVKKYLYLVSQNMYPEIGRGTIDGIYDSQTRKSVASYQKIKKLPETGTVDLNTFNLLYKDYYSTQRRLLSKGYIITEDGFPLSIGTMNEDVRIIHAMIGELNDIYTELSEVGHGSYYSKGTAESVKMLRKIFGMPDGEHVDEELYQRMVTEIEAIRRNGKTNDLKTVKRV